MPLFRKQRGHLDESLKTTVIVKDIDQLKRFIMADWEMWIGAIREDGTPFTDFDIKIEPYYGGCDYRCGWYTQIVSTTLMRKDRFDAVGFLSEPLE